VLLFEALQFRLLLGLLFVLQKLFLLLQDLLLVNLDFLLHLFVVLLKLYRIMVQLLLVDLLWDLRLFGMCASLNSFLLDGWLILRVCSVTRTVDSLLPFLCNLTMPLILKQTRIHHSAFDGWLLDFTLQELFSSLKVFVFFSDEVFIFFVFVQQRQSYREILCGFLV